ncbi:potassium channel family protein [Trichothermofontia sp.]
MSQRQSGPPRIYDALERGYRQIRRDLLGGALALFSLILGGTLGYRLIEGWRWLDALYMTVITLATVGFGETYPLSDRGRIFTIGLILAGVVCIAYLANRFTEAIIQGYFQHGIRQRRQRRFMEQLFNHYILCGFGRTGRQVALEFAAEGIAFVVMDADPMSIELAQQRGYFAIQGDATLDASLQKLGIERAICLVTALPSDAENLYTVLSAKALNPGIRTIARANTEEGVQKLQRGGADAVISPYVTGGRRMAAAALRPQVMDFVDGILTGTDRTYYVEEYRLEPNTCTCLGQSLREARLRSQTGVLVLAIRRRDGKLIAGPTAETILEAGDLLICMGTAEQLRSLNQLLSPLRPDRFRPPRQL